MQSVITTCTQNYYSETDHILYYKCNYYSAVFSPNGGTMPLPHPLV